MSAAADTPAAGAKGRSAADVAQLFGNVQSFLGKDDFKRALKTLSKLLEILPADKDALRAQCVCLCYLSQYEEALAICEANPEFSFERAYCLYRLNKLPDALSVLEQAAEHDMRHQLITAQVCYRSNQFDRCIEIYEQAVSSSGQETTAELLSNLVAAYMAAGRARAVLSAPWLSKRRIKESYELAYNLACVHLEAGEINSGIALLRQALETCKEPLADLTPAEFADETAAIKAQLGYALQLSGDHVAAAELYSELIMQRPSDAVVLAVACNNMAVLKGADDLFESAKRMRTTAVEEVQGKLTKAHEWAFALNRSVLQCHMGKEAECVAAVDKLAELDATSAMPTVVRASLMHRQKNAAGARQLLQEFIAGHVETAMPAQLMLAQLEVEAGNHDAAASLLANLGGVSNRPATVITLATLFDQANRVEEANSTVSAALSAWLGSSDSSLQKNAVKLAKWAAAFHLRRNQRPAAIQVCESILRTRLPQADTITFNAYLVIARALTDPVAAATLAAKLTNAIPAAAPVDATALEALEILPTARPEAAAAVVDETKTDAVPERRVLSPEAVARRRAKKKARRLARYLKTLRARGRTDAEIASQRLDPERWLPWHMRASRGRRGRRRNNRGYSNTGGSQGMGATSAAEMAKLDAAARKKETPAPAPAPAPARKAGKGKKGRH